MKKLMLAVIVGLMVIASASIAAAEITVGGNIEMRYDLWNNLDLNRSLNQNTTRTQTQSFFGDRILLNVDAKITEGLEAFVEMDSNSSERVWGFNEGPGAPAGFSSGPLGTSAVNYHGEDLFVRQAWINFMVPGIPVGVKVGHQPLALGHGISLDTHRLGTDAILVYAKPIDQLLLAGVYSKVAETSSSLPGVLTGREGQPIIGSTALTLGDHNNADVWAALANFTWAPNNTVGVNYLFVHDAIAPDALGIGSGVIKLHNIGLAADGGFGPVTYKAEVDYQNINTDIEGSKRGANNAWAGMLGVGAKVAIVNVGMEAAYGTGNNSNDNKDGHFALGSRAYISPYGETSYNYAFLYNDKIGQGAQVFDSTGTVIGFNQGGGGGQGFGDGTGGFGLANTGYIKVTAGVNPTDKLAIDMAALYLRASGDTDTSGIGWGGRSRDLGWEVDAHAGYKIYDNLNLDLTGGVFVPGAWYAMTGRPAGSVVADAKQLTDSADPDSPLKRNLAYGLESKLTVKF